MKVVGYIAAGAFLLAILNALIVAALAVGSMTLLLGAYFKPRETIGLLLVLLLWGLAANHPLACIIVAGLAYVAVKLRQWQGKGRPAGRAVTLPPGPRQTPDVARWRQFRGRA